MKKVLIIGVILLLLFLIIGAFAIGYSINKNNSNKINIPENYDERIEYCNNWCGTLYSHNACANDCMAGVVSQYVQNPPPVSCKSNINSSCEGKIRIDCTLPCNWG